MRYYKIIDNGYILMIGIGNGGEEITEEEYNEILAVILAKPQATDTTDYRLKTDLTWEPYEVEPIDPETEELAEDETLSILMGEE